MNERIKELVENIISDPSLNEKWPEFYESFRRNGTLYLHVFAENFAKLLIEKCIEQCTEVAENHRVSNKVTESDVCAYKIKNYFGAK